MPTLQNIEMKAYFLPLDLGSADVILGMQWPESLGGMQVNWKLTTMLFQVGGVMVLLLGGPTLSASLVSLKVMWKALREQGDEILLELGSIRNLNCPSDTNIPVFLQRVMD